MPLRRPSAPRINISRAAGGTVAAMSREKHLAKMAAHPAAWKFDLTRFSSLFNKDERIRSHAWPLGRKNEGEDI